jgi:hypothetical protein
MFTEKFKEAVRSPWGAIVLYGSIGAIGGLTVGRTTAGAPTVPPAVPAPVAASASVTPVAAPLPKWDDARLDARFKRIEHQLDRDEDRLNRHGDLLADVNEKVALHRHDKAGNAIVPHGIEPGLGDAPSPEFLARQRAFLKIDGGPDAR